MPGMIRRTLLLSGLAAAAGGAALWYWRSPGAKVSAYGDDPRQVLDVTLPRGLQPAPVLVMIHGGAFKFGDKSELTVPTDILQAGIAVVRLNYRLSGTDPWPAQAEDCLAAIVHLQRDNLVEFFRGHPWPRQHPFALNRIRGRYHDNAVDRFMATLFEQERNVE